MIIKNKFKFIRSITTIGFPLLIFYSTNIERINKKEETILYTVNKSDTLWTIAQ